MIKTVTVTNFLQESLKLNLRYPEASGLVIKKIDGLGPPKANINTTELSTMDGSVVNSTKITSRNIVLELAYLFAPTIEQVRQKTYKYFPIKKPLKLEILTDHRQAEIHGYVESNEPDIFSPMSGAQISIICPDPFFYSTAKDGYQHTTFSGTEPMFEFPFSNESLTEDLIIFGECMQMTQNTVYYKGDADVGITINIHAFGDAEMLTIYNSQTREVFKLNTDKLESITGNKIISGDQILISTVKGNKYARLIRQGVTSNILNCIERSSDWFQLTKGDNVFIFDAEDGLPNLQYSIENRIVYEGM